MKNLHLTRVACIYKIPFDLAVISRWYERAIGWQKGPIVEAESLRRTDSHRSQRYGRLLSGATEHRPHSLTSPLVTMSPTSQSTDSYGCGTKEITDGISGVDIHGAHASGGDSESESANDDAMTWTSQEDELASALEDCVSVFRSGLQQLQDISVEDLVFCEVPEDSDADLLTITPPLQVLATANLPFLEYQDWIMKLYLETQKLDCGTFERCGRIKHSLLDDLRNEWTKLEELKHRAWQKVSLRGPECGSAQITDTCECYNDHI
jgi:hypothetical protein